MITLAAVAGPPLGVLSAMGILWGVAFQPLDVVLFAIFYVVCGLGISIGYHRLFTHCSFETTPVLRATLAILGSMTLQGPVTQWVTDHRRHHALSDQPGDPHSPHADHGDGYLAAIGGLWHAHVGWLFKTKGMERGERWGADLFRDRLIRRIDHLYLVWLALTFALPFAAGYLIGGSTARGLEALIWAGVLRVFLFQHMTWSVNSICHRFGRRGYFTRDESRNNWPIAIFTFGEGWHNNHHAFPASAVHGLDRFQFDLSGHIIHGLEKLGWAWNVRQPDAAQRARRRNAAGTPG